MDNKQIELDAFENTILKSFFGEDWKHNNSFKLLEIMRPGFVQNYIDKFETLVTPFMNDDGLINGVLLKKTLEIKSPSIASVIPEKNFGLQEISKEIIKLFKGE